MTDNYAEPGDIETLNIDTEFIHSNNNQEKVCIAIVPGVPKTVSLMLIQFDKKWRVSALQSCLSIEELELVIDGLTLAKLRMEILQMKGGPEKTLMLEVTKE